MPNYIYKCKACGGEKEVFHSISEIDNPTEETLQETSCPFDRDCEVSWRDKLGIELPDESDLRLRRVPQAPQVMGMYNGSSLSGEEKKAHIQKERKSRSHQDFLKNIYPAIPNAEKRFFKDKWKKSGKKDSIDQVKKIEKKL